MCLICVHDFKHFLHNASQHTAEINRVWSERSTCDRRVKRWFLKFHIENQRCRRRPSTEGNQHPKTLV